MTDERVDAGRELYIAVHHAGVLLRDIEDSLTIVGMSSHERQALAANIKACEHAVARWKLADPEFFAARPTGTRERGRYMGD